MRKDLLSIWTLRTSISTPGKLRNLPAWSIVGVKLQTYNLWNASEMICQLNYVVNDCSSIVVGPMVVV